MFDRQVMTAVIAAAFAVSPLTRASDAHSTHGAHQHATATASDAGKPGDAARATRTIDVRMSDTMRFDPATISVRRGETVRFRVTNTGKLLHEMVIGTRGELDAHAAMMRDHPDMQHDDGQTGHVAPGSTRDVIWQFTKAGRFNYACLLPGHYEAGMVGEIQVR